MKSKHWWMILALSGALSLVVACGDGDSSVNCDVDEDGYLATSCDGDDCDDGDSTIHPGAAEICDDNVDQDCNGADLQCDCDDADADDYLDTACGGDDCDDGDANIHPGAVETCNGIDDDCNDTVDDMPPLTCGVGVCAVEVAACVEGQLQECLPAEPTEEPEATCDDGLDNDCDGDADGADFDCCEDGDGDGYLDALCGGDDCDDADAEVHPGHREVCGNDTDDDCDPATEDVVDADEDGADCTVDCDENDSAINPSAEEICMNLADDNCDGLMDCDDPTCEGSNECLLCGNGTLDGLEECDDGNECPMDGCAGCHYSQTLVTTSFQIDSVVAYDLDNLDEDDNIYTGVDNVMASSTALNALLNPQMEGSVDNGFLIQMMTVTDLDNVPYNGTGTPGYESDPEITVVLFAGVDPDCPANRDPVPWLDESKAPMDFYSNSDYFGMPESVDCRPSVLIGEEHDSTNGIYPTNSDSAQPDAPYVHLHKETIVVDTGMLGMLEMKNAYVEGTLLNNGREITALTDGRIAGIVPASFLAAVDLSTQPFIGANCPTALHAILAFVGDIDQEAEFEQGVAIDTIVFEGGGGFCMSPLVIDHCVDGETLDIIAGPECYTDPRIGDGFSAGFAVEAIYARIVEQVSGAVYCH